MDKLSPSSPATAVAGPDYHALAVAEVASATATDLALGLTAAEAKRRLAEFGRNVLPEHDAPRALQLVLSQFTSVLVYILLLAAVVSLLLGDILEFASILVITALNAVLGFVQEYRAERALSALKALSAPGATVLRDGSPDRIAAEDVVPGDVLLIEDGDIVAADARVTESTGMATNEAMLTGESMPEEKVPQAVPSDAELAERQSMVHYGTLVTRGRGRAIAVRTGARTEMGRIAELVSRQPREQTPLQRELATVGRYLALAAGALSMLVFVVGIIRGLAAGDMFLTAASLAVAAIPEGLPAASTIVLALGVQRMAKRHVIVRRLSSVETLGAVTTIFTDKTGTLTLNQMRVAEVWSPGGGDEDLLRAAVLCNNASLHAAGDGGTGDPTEQALLAFARERGADIDRHVHDYPREYEVPFEASRARMTVVVRCPDRSRAAFVKGAPDVVLSLCSSDGGGALTPDTRAAITSRVAALAVTGMRVLAFAQRSLEDQTHEDEIERDLAFVGLAALADPLRPEAPLAIAQAHEAGIRVIMLTGDQPATAASVGGSLGLGRDVVHGREIDALDGTELGRRIAATSVFARVTSDHKLRFIQAARDNGEVVAMTGDGVNDAPALRAADVGVAMGRVGTDVAREASDLVLTDDNFGSIVAAVEEGRAIHANISRFIHFLLSCNAAEVAVVFVGLVVFGEAILTPLQILFVNLLTDGLPALALGVEASDPGVMQRRPRPANIGLLSSRSLVPVAVMGGLIALTTLLAYVVGATWEDDGLGTRFAFATLVASQLGSSTVFRSESRTALSLPANYWLLGAIGLSAAALLAVFYVPVLSQAFDGGPLTAAQWGVVTAMSLLPLAAGESLKVLARRMRPSLSR